MTEIALGGFFVLYAMLGAAWTLRGREQDEYNQGSDWPFDLLITTVLIGVPFSVWLLLTSLALLIGSRLMLRIAFVTAALVGGGLLYWAMRQPPDVPPRMPEPKHNPHTKPKRKRKNERLQ